ncbi:MAG: Wzz/FepE/Etk N-terminal domain-containing protein [bacterium]
MEEEISLRELIEIILRRKLVIAGITAVALISSFILSFFILTPEYKASATLKMTKYQVNGSALVLSTNIEDYIQLFTEDYFREIAADFESPQYIESATSVIINDQGLLQIDVSGENAEEVALIANTVANNFPDYSWQVEQKRLADIVSNWEERLQEFEAQLDEVIAELEALKSQDLWFGHLEQEAEILGAKRAELKMDIRRLKDEIRLLQEESPLSVRTSAVSPNKPISPRRSLNVALAGVLGLMVGTFIAFFVDYWESTRPGNIEEKGLINKA